MLRYRTRRILRTTRDRLGVVPLVFGGYVRHVSYLDHSQNFTHDGRPHTAYCFAWDSEWWMVTFTNRDGHAGESVRLKRERYGLAEALERGVEGFVRTADRLGKLPIQL